MNVIIVDRLTLLKNLKHSKLLSKRQLRIVFNAVRDIADAREIAKALVAWRFATKFQAKMLLVGRKSGFVLGRYCVLDEVGHGGMGRVYKAVHKTMNRVVALKVLSPKSVATERGKLLFRQEARAAARLMHPNIVMTFDAAEDDGRCFLAMELVKGPNLEQYVEHKGALPIGLACEIVFQTAAGLQHAHEYGVVHRDIKPANLLLQQPVGAGTLQVKILDFGLARLRQRNVVQPDSREVMGTPDFLAPEQARQVDAADIRSDLYSLGCTFYYLLTGQVPFPHGNIVHKLKHHECDPPTPISTLRPDVSAEVVAIVTKLMAKNPAERYQTPDDLMTVLAPYAVPGTLNWVSAAPAASKATTECSSNRSTSPLTKSERPTRSYPKLRLLERSKIAPSGLVA